MTSSFFLAENFHFLRFLPFLIYCFLYLLYALICIFIVLCCFLMLKLKLLTSSFFMTSLIWINLLSNLSRIVIWWVISPLNGFMISIIVSQCSVNWKISFEFHNKKSNITVQVILQWILLCFCYCWAEIMMLLCWNYDAFYCHPIMLFGQITLQKQQIHRKQNPLFEKCNLAKWKLWKNRKLEISWFRFNGWWRY